MIQSISTHSLPCGEIANYPFRNINIVPVSFIDLIYHTSNYNANSSAYDKFYYLYALLRRKIKEINLLYLPDIYFIAYVLLSYSISENFDVTIKYRCGECGTSNSALVKLTEVKMRKIDKLEKEVEFSHDIKTIIKYPTGDYIEKHLWKYQTPKNDYKVPINLAMALISFIDYERDPVGVEKMVFGATHKDAIKMKDVVSFINANIQPYEHTCSKCSTINVIDLTEFYLDNLYELLVLNNS